VLNNDLGTAGEVNHPRHKVITNEQVITNELILEYDHPAGQYAVASFAPARHFPTSATCTSLLLLFHGCFFACFLLFYVLPFHPCYSTPPTGRARQTRTAARSEGQPFELRHGAPLLGGHTTEILAALGVCAEETKRLNETETGVVKSP
jgi:crotonobetainyl-CoA:carnitine CoA-transferase CaiB-like acyl-CoA transferase